MNIVSVEWNEKHVLYNNNNNKDLWVNRVL